MFVRIPHNQGDAWQVRDFDGRPLRIAPSNYYFAGRVLALDTPDCRPCILFCGSRYRAGVKDHELCGGTFRGTIKPLLLKLSLDGSPVSLGGPAAEIFYVKAGHRTILAYIRLWMGQLPKSAQLRRLDYEARGIHETQDPAGG